MKWLKRRNQPTALSAELSPFQTRALIVATANSMLGDERLMDSPVRPFAAEHIGWLINRAHERDVQAAQLTEMADGDYNATIAIGGLLYEGRVAMRIAYGDTWQAGTDLPMAPACLEDAVNAQEATDAVREHMNRVFDADVDKYLA